MSNDTFIHLALCFSIVLLAGGIAMLARCIRQQGATIMALRIYLYEYLTKESET